MPEGMEEETTVWNLAYGANMSAHKMEERGVKVLRSFPAQVRVL